MENKFVPGILIGAVIGGAISLADKSTQFIFHKKLPLFQICIFYDVVY
jgi:hypothetical protein